MGGKGNWNILPVAVPTLLRLKQSLENVAAAASIQSNCVGVLLIDSSVLVILSSLVTLCTMVLTV